jgi:sec-independent protein translocase protein TatA
VIRRRAAALHTGTPRERRPRCAAAVALSAVGIENPIHLLFIALVALLVLGPKRLPEVARTLGNGLREFRNAISGEGAHSHGEIAPPVVAGAAPQPAVPAPVEQAAPAVIVTPDASTPPIASTAAAPPSPARKALTQTAGVSAPPAADPAPSAHAPVPAATAPAAVEAAPGVDPA